MKFVVPSTAQITDCRLIVRANERLVRREKVLLLFLLKTPPPPKGKVDNNGFLSKEWRTIKRSNQCCRARCKTAFLCGRAAVCAVIFYGCRMLDRLRVRTDWWPSYAVVEEESADPPRLTMELQRPCTSSASSPPALVGTEDAFAAFISALSGAPALPHTDGLPAGFKPCPQQWCVECLAHNLQVYTNRSRVFIAPTLSWRLINDIALRLTQPLVATKVNGPITEQIFQASIRRLQERIATLSLSEKLLTRVGATAIALMQWHSAHYFILGQNATCVLPRLHWTDTNTDHPRVDLIATGSMIGNNVALPVGRRYPFTAVYSPDEDTSELWAQLTNQQQQHWLNSFIYLRSFRHAVHRGFPTGQLPSLLEPAESSSSSSEDEEEERIDDEL